ncbi:N-terminal domain of NEFA-interacting nuclear protein NIP30-domain-containing protein [Xylaria cubensis]|nr:N-terminal domain of NEFA-interacting nuclear protein NIP30-domain-containing protein [Xylaria cubensis]
MTSRFVSGGTIAGDGPVDEEVRKAAVEEAGGEGEKGPGNNKNAREWEAVQKDLDEERKRREEARRANAEGGGGERSLYEILQANKAAKQAAFEEQNRIRNQFRALDDDEIDFLHGVSDERRAEEERVRRETEEGLAGFREKQRATASTATAGGNEDAAGVEDGNEEWGNTAPGRKRKREKEREKGVLKGVKRRTSIGTKEEGKEKGGGDAVANERVKKPPSTATESATPKEVAVTAPAKANTTEKPKPKPAFGLVDYGSDEDDD